MVRRRKQIWESVLRAFRGSGVTIGVCLSLVLWASVVLAAVTFAGFSVEAGEHEIFVHWETASELDNLGFYVWRSEASDGEYAKLPLGVPSNEQFVPSQDFGIGAFYVFTDVQVTPGITYFYKVQDVPINGGEGEFVGPDSAEITVAPTAPPTVTDTPAPEPSATPAAGETATPVASVRFWAEPEKLNAGECSTVQWQVENIQAVYFDDIGVPGQGARTFCPCVDETHHLVVQYWDGRRETFTVTLEVVGECDATSASSSLPTPVPPTGTPSGSARVTPTVVTPLPTATPPHPATATVVSSGVPRITPRSPLPTPGLATDTVMVTAPVTHSDRIVGMDTQPPTVAAGATVGPVIEGASRFGSFPSLLLVPVALVGVGLILGGIWLWRRG